MACSSRESGESSGATRPSVASCEEMLTICAISWGDECDKIQRNNIKYYLINYIFLGTLGNWLASRRESALLSGATRTGPASVKLHILI